MLNKLNIEEDFGKRYHSLFENKKYKELPFIDRGFATDRQINYGAVLFIGLNPSFRKGSVPGSFFYSIEEAKTDQYFKKFWAIADFCGRSCAHLDLIGLRETSQKAIDTLAKTQTQFIYENLNLTKEILENSKPRVIVVTDTKARTFLGKNQKGDKNVWMGYEFGKMRKDGTFRIENSDSNLRNVPWFFSGMLSGQRALDLGSFERLKWHINSVINNEL